MDIIVIVRERGWWLIIPPPSRVVFEGTILSRIEGELAGGSACPTKTRAL